MGKSMKILLSVVLLIFGSALPVSAAWRVVTGKVLGTDGGVVVGATVLARGDNNEVIDGTPSGLDGRFVLKISATRAETISLEVSSIGYAKYEKEFFLDRDSTAVVVKLKAVLVDVGRIEVRPLAALDETKVELSRQEVTDGARASFLPSNPISAVKEPQVIREGSAHSSRLRINGTSPTYFVNGIEIGRNPNHYGMFSIIPAAVIDEMTVRTQGTPARLDAPSTVEFETRKRFESHADAQVNLSAIEAGGTWSVGGGRWFSMGAVRKSVLDEIVERISVESGRRTIPPTSFRDVFASTGIRLGEATHFLVDQYHVTDGLRYRTEPTARNPLGASTSLATSEHYVGGRLEMLRPGAFVKLNGAVRTTAEEYKAEPEQSASTQTQPILNLEASGTQAIVGAEATLTIGEVELTVGDQVRYVTGQRIDLTQQNWNFLPPDAASDIPYVYQAELNVLYGEYHGTRRRTDNAAFASVRWKLGRVRMESGVRAGHFGALAQSEWLTIRQMVTISVGDEKRLNLFAGTFVEDPARRVLEPYQPLIQMDYHALLPIRTALLSAQYEHGPVTVSAFRKRIDNLPVVSPDFSRVDGGVAQQGFLRTNPGGRNDFFGGDVALAVDGLMRGKLHVDGYYGYTHAVKTTAGVTGSYELSAPHRFMARGRYDASAKVRLGAELGVRSGYAYTPLPSSEDAYGTDRYSREYYEESLRAENTARFPVHASLNLSVAINLGGTEVYGSVANVTNRANPIISAPDGYVYDAGVLPSVGVTKRF